MLEYKSIASLTLNEARVLLAPQAVRDILNVNLEALSGSGETPLTDALASGARPSERWAQLLEGFYVSLLDVNRAELENLRRIPGLSSAQVDLLVKARPYFTLDDLGREGADLQEVARLATPYLVHEGFVFIDKLRGRMVELIPSPAGVLVMIRQGTNDALIDSALQTAGLSKISSNPEERLFACKWDISLDERPVRLRKLKETEALETVAPFLEDAEGQVRHIYPDRLDLSLRPEAGQAAWERIIDRFGLLSIEHYEPTYGSVRVKAHPHDLGALYRTLRELAKEPAVHFVEPTYLVADNS